MRRLLAACIVLAAVVVGCRPSSSTTQLRLPARIQSLTAAQKDLLRATIEIEGLLGESRLRFNDDQSAVSGDFTVDVSEKSEHAVTLRLFGRFDEESGEVLLARFNQNVTFTPGEEAALDVAGDDFVTDGEAIFDVNKNDASNLSDLIADIDPAPPRAFLDVSDETLRFQSGVLPGGFVRQVIIVQNQSERAVEVTPQVFGAPGVSLTTVDANLSAAGGVARSLAPITLQPFAEQLVGVTFAPTNGFLVTGRVLFSSLDPTANLRQAAEVDVIANSDGNPAPVLGGYVVDDLAAGADLGAFSLPVKKLDAAHLFGGLSISPDAGLGVAPLEFTGQQIAGVNADAAFVVTVPPRHRFSVVLSGLRTDVDLALFTLGAGDSVVDDADHVLRSRRPGTSPEALELRNDVVDGQPATNKRVLVVLGRDVAGSGIEDALVPFSLLAQLVSGPELDAVAPITPNKGPLEGGVTVVVKGAGFQDGAVVRFGAARADVANTTVSADGRVVATVLPPGAFDDAGRRVTVVVSNPGPEAGGDGQSATLPEGFSYQPPAPQVTSLSPSTGSTRGGTPITIRGAFFSARGGVPDVVIGGSAASDVVFVSATELNATAPAGTAGPANVVVRCHLGEGVDVEGSAANAFFFVAPQGEPPVLEGVDPAVGTVDGGDDVVLDGSGFVAGASVLFGGTLASAITFVDGNTLTVRTPPHAPGAVAVVVVNPDGQSDALAASFTYETPPPASLAAVPDYVSLLGGSRVYVDGADFRAGANAVFVQGNLRATAPATLFVSSTRVVVTSPTGLDLGTAQLVVRNPDGQESAAVDVEVRAPAGAAPRILSLSPSVLRVGDRTPVIISGTGFSASPILFAGDETTPITSSTSTSIVFDPPSVGAASSIVLRVINDDGQADVAVLTFLDAIAPVVTAVSPGAVHAAVAGDVVTISGTNLLPISNAQVSVRDSSGQTSAATLLTATATTLTVRLDAALAEADGYVVVLAYPDNEVTTPPFAALAPVAFSAQVVAGRALEGASFSLLVQGANLNRAHVRFVRFTDADDVDVDVTPSLITEGLVRADVGSSALVQGAYAVSLVYDNGFRVAVDDDFVVSGACGNALIDAGEDCDVTNFGGDDCSDYGFFGGTLRCSASCSINTGLCNLCGNGLLDELEQCDGQNFNGDTCASRGHDGGILTCSSSCTINEAACTDCGNGVVQAGEECDAESVPVTCADRGFNRGNTACAADCTVDDSACFSCGDGQLDPLEECDSADLAGETCLTRGFDGGNLACGASCLFNDTGCTTCGNGVVEGAEECDGANLQGRTCSSLGFNQGTLTCSATCGFVTTTCSTCGNNRCDGVETAATCAADCVASCGDGTCGANESCSSCPRDCACEAPFSLSVVSGNNQSATRSRDLALPVVVRAVDGAGQPLRGQQITFAAPPGGFVNPVTANTNASGDASVLLTVPRSIGAATFTASGNGPDGAPLQGSPVGIGVTATDVGAGVITAVLNAIGGAGNTAGGTAASKTRVSVEASGVVGAPNGDLFVADRENHRVLKIDVAGTATVVAGTGTAGFTGDNGPATLARIARPSGLALDAAGNLYIAELDNDVVRRVRTDGIIERFAGGGATGQPNDGDGNLAQQAFIDGPVALAFAPNGDLLIGADVAENIRKVAAGSGVISTVVASSICTSGTGLRMRFFQQGMGLAVDRQGRLVFTGVVNDFGGCPITSGDVVMRVNADGSLSRVLGGGVDPEASAALAVRLTSPQGVAVDAAGNVYVAEAGGHRVRKASVLGAASTVAGSAVAGLTGDGGPATAARLNGPSGLFFNAAGDLFVLENVNETVRVVRAVGESTAPVLTATITGGLQTGTMTRLVQNPLTVEVKDQNGNVVAGVAVDAIAPAGGAMEPASAVTDALGKATVLATLPRAPGTHTYAFALTAPDGSPVSNSPVSTTLTATDLPDRRVITLLNQRGTAGLLATGGAATRIQVNLSDFAGVAVDVDGGLFVSDPNNHRVIKIDASGQSSLVAGTPGVAGFVDDVVANAGSKLNDPRGLTLDSRGNLYIADRGNNRVRVVTRSNGRISTFAGNGAPGAGNFGDGLLATGANLSFPNNVIVAPDVGADPGDVFITDQGHELIRKVQVDSFGVPNTISTAVAGNQVCTSGVFRPRFFGAGGMGFDKSRRLYFTAAFSDFGGCPLPSADAVWRLESNGALTVLAGGPTVAETGAAFGNRLNGASGLAVDAAGNVYVSETASHRVRRIDVLGTISTAVGDGVAGFTGDTLGATVARFNRPTHLGFDAEGNLFVVDAANHALREVRRLGDTTPASARMLIVSGNAQSVTLDQIASAPLRIRVVDGANNPIPGVPVTWSALTPGGVVFQPNVITSGAGETTTVVRVGRDPTAPQQYAATAVTWLDPAPIVDAPAVFSLTATRPAAGSLVAVLNTDGIQGASAAVGSATEVRANLDFSGVALDVDGTLFVSDTFNHRVLMISPEGEASVFAGTGVAGFQGDEDLAVNARLNQPRGLALDASGRLFIADTVNDRVRAVNVDGTIESVAGGGPDNLTDGDGGAATNAFIDAPIQLSFAPDGDLIIVSDVQENIRRIDAATQVITTQLSANQVCTGGVLRPRFLFATKPVFDAQGRMLFGANISDFGGCPVSSREAIMRQELDGTFSIVVGAGAAVDNAAASAVGVTLPGGMVMDGADLIYVDINQHRVKRVAGGVSSGTVTTIAGNGTQGFASLQLPGSGQLSFPNDVVRDAVTGDLYITESGSEALRLRVGP